MHHMGPGGGAPAPASPQQFCLRWNNYQTNLTNVFDQLLQSESFVDVTLACDGHSVKAHKMVLSACSPYFQSLFFDNPCQHPIVILKDIQWPELKAVVEFMYKGEINVSQEQIGPLLKVAESLKIRGLADVNGEADPMKGLVEDVSVSRQKKRRRTSATPNSPEGSESLEGRALELVTTSPPGPQASCQPTAPPQPPPPQQSGGLMPLALPPPPPPQQPAQQQPNQPNPDDMEIKPGIAEMIREEERAKMLESSHAWLGASTSSLAADSYQYQLQSMWQKCWNTNQSLVHNLRFRERGPLKSWRPETMAEAIMSVLKEGLSLSQAARKYDIPYPTFVLYANRVHNMLGPSADGGSDLRPKGRGRPQRILLGIWPEEHIRGVIRAVVFRDPQHIKEEPINLGYRIPVRQPTVHNYSSPSNNPQNVAPPPINNNVSESSPVGGGVSPNSAAAAVVAVAHNLRQQMLAAAVHHHNHQEHPPPHNFGFFAAAAAAHCGNGNNLMLHSPSPVDSSPSSSPLTQPNNNMEMGLNLGFKPMPNDNQMHPQQRNDHPMFKEEIEDLVKRPMQSETPKMKPQPQMGYKSHDMSTARADHLFQDDMEGIMKRPQQPGTPKMKPPQQMGYNAMPNDLSTTRPEHMFQEDMENIMKRPQAPSTPKVKPPQIQGYQPMPNDLSTTRSDHMFQEDMENMMKRPQGSDTPKVKVGIGVSGMPFTGACDSYVPQRNESFFQDDIEDLVKSPQGRTTPKEAIKVEQRTE